MVDILGLPIAIGVSAANCYDGTEGIKLFPIVADATSRFELLRVGNAYKGQFTQIAEGQYLWKVEFGLKPESSQGFVPQKGRWQVERCFAWLNPFRRFDKDHEKTTESSVALISLAFISILFGRIK
jgi:transposase